MWNLPREFHAVQGGLENIRAEAPHPGLDVASIVALMGTGLVIARQGIGRTNVIDVEREVT